MRTKVIVLALLTVLVAAIGISPIMGAKPTDKVTGGGWIMNLSNKSTFGFNAMNKSGSVSGNLQYNDHGMGVKGHANVTTLAVTGSTATLMGTIWINGTPYPYTATVMDGSPDTFSISIPTFLPPYSNSGNVTGQIKIH